MVTKHAFWAKLTSKVSLFLLQLLSFVQRKCLYFSQSYVKQVAKKGVSKSTFAHATLKATRFP